MAQPAERIRKTAATKTKSTSRSGQPLAAIHKAISVGQSSSRMPIGLSRSDEQGVLRECFAPWGVDGFV